MKRENQNDGELLKEFAETGREEPFTELVRRHSPMVLGVCRRAAGNEPDAEDAAQAVFLTLAQKAKSLCGRPSVGGWLFQTACYVSVRARESRGLRQTREREAAAMNPESHVDADEHKHEETRRLLDQALNALPEKYRLPVVLHHLEERPQAEVAKVLGVGLSALAMRLNRARTMLASKLARQGVALSAAGVSVVLTAKASAATETFVAATSKAAVATAGGKGAVGAAVSTKVAALVKGTLKGMLMKQIAVVATVAITMGGVTAGTVVAVHKEVVKRQERRKGELDKALYAAVVDGELKKVKELLSQGADPNMEKESQVGNEIVRHKVLAAANSPEMVDALVKAGADVDGRSAWSQTALIFQAGFADNEVELHALEALLDHGADINAQDDNGNTALMHAVKNGEVAAVKLLLERGAKVDIEDKGGSTALSECVWTSVKDGAQKIRLLLDHGAKINQPMGEDHETALMTAASIGNLEIVKYLVEQGADVNARMTGGGSALAYAAIGGRVDVVKYLIERGADVNARADGDQSVLEMTLDVPKSHARLKEKWAEQGGGDYPVPGVPQEQLDEVVKILRAAGAKE